MAKLLIFHGLSKESFDGVHGVDGEDTNISDFSDFAGGEQLAFAPTAVCMVTHGEDEIIVEQFGVLIC